MVKKAKHIAIGFYPCGQNALTAWQNEKNAQLTQLAPTHNVTALWSTANRPRSLDINHLSTYGLGGEFRDWLFANYTAIISSINHQPVVQFVNEEDATIFTLTWSA